MKLTLLTLLILAVITGCLPVPPPQRSDVQLSDSARALQEAAKAEDQTSSGQVDLPTLLQSLEVPPHPRSERTLAELQGEDGDALLEESSEIGFSLIPPPHPRVDAEGNDVAGSDGLVAHEPLIRPTRQPTVDFGATKNDGESHQVAAATESPATATSTPSAATATSIPPTAVPPTATEIPATATSIPPTSVPLPTSVPPTATAEPTQEPTVQPTAGPVAFSVIPEESTISYQVYEQFIYVGGQGLVTGKTQQITGELVLLLDEPPDIESGFFEVNIASMTSRDPRRDLAIRTEWLESDSYPVARFEIEALDNGPVSWADGESAEFQLVGELTMRDVTNNVTFDVNATLTDGAITGSATAEILMTDYGFEPPVVANLVEATNEVTIIVYLNAAAQQ